MKELDDRYIYSILDDDIEKFLGKECSGASFLDYAKQSTTTKGVLLKLDYTSIFPFLIKSKNSELIIPEVYLIIFKDQIKRENDQKSENKTTEKVYRYVCRKFGNELRSKNYLAQKYWIEFLQSTPIEFFQNSPSVSGFYCYEKIKNGKSTKKGRFIAFYSQVLVDKKAKIYEENKNGTNK